MEFKLEKIDRNSKNYNHVINFIASENMKLYFYYRPELNKLLVGERKQVVFKTFLESFTADVCDNPLIYAVYLKDEVIGAGYMNENYLNSLFVSEKYRNMGIGTNILKILLETCGDFKVIKLHASLKAISLYERFSFTKVEDISGENNYVPMQLERGYHEK